MPANKTGNPLKSFDCNQILGQARGWRRRRFSLAIFPTPPHFPYTLPVPSRIHRQACRRDGAGAGFEGETQNLIIRVRGKWSPSGDTGEADKVWTGLPASDARKSAPDVPVRHTGWLNGRFCRAASPSEASSRSGECRMRVSDRPAGWCAGSRGLIGAGSSCREALSAAAGFIPDREVRVGRSSARLRQRDRSAGINRRTGR